MIMLLGAFLIGFTIAWMLRNQVIKTIETDLGECHSEIRNLNISNENLDISKSKLKVELDQCLESKSGMVDIEELHKATAEIKKERERSETARNSLMEIESGHEALKQELQIKIDQMLPQTEANKLRAEVNRLRMFNTSLEEELRDLKVKASENNSPPTPIQAIDQIDEVTPADFVTSIGLKPASYSDKDDLKKISGVGPFIENKLHRLGIYTFDQIASMTPEQAEQINQAIEFFPGRIIRDDWVAQAKRLIID